MVETDLSNCRYFSWRCVRDHVAPRAIAFLLSRVLLAFIRDVARKYEPRRVNRLSTRLGSLLHGGDDSSLRSRFMDRGKSRDNYPAHPRRHECLAVLGLAVCWSRDATVMHDT